MLTLTLSLPVRGAWIEISLGGNSESHVGSLPVRGAWIEITLLIDGFELPMSLPVRGAWIEMQDGDTLYSVPRTSLPVRGAWIEILETLSISRDKDSRSPCGERGLKSSSLD